MPFGRNSAASIDAYDAAEAHCRHLLSKIDVGRMHIAGHSFGGATAILAVQSSLPALSEDPPFKSCLLFDPWVEPLPERAFARGMGDLPTLAICSGAWGCDQKAKFYDQIERLLLDKSVSPRSVLATMPGTLHNWVADGPFWGPWTLLKFMDLAADVAPDVASSNTVEAACAFMGAIDRDVPCWVSDRNEESAKAHGLFFPV